MEARVSPTPPPGWADRVRQWTAAETLRRHEDKVLLLVTLIIGVLVGLVVAGFIYVTENLGSRMYPAGGAAWRRVLIPVAGSLLTGFLLARYFPNARGSGIPQTKAALFLRDGFIRFRTVVGKFVCSSISLASGIALGREGPSVQVGAGLASVIGRRIGLGRSSLRQLIPIGSAAALAAAFNTPVAAVLFSLEEVMGDLHAPVLGSIVLSSATSWIVLHLLLGDEPLFHVPAYQLVSPIEFVAYAALGVAGGLVSVCFVRLLLWIRKRFKALPPWTLWLQPAAGGLLVGLMGWFVPQVLGVGYGHVGEALNGQMALQVMALLVVLKLIATAACYGTGNAGGIFGPSLFIGAMMGGAVGGIAHQWLPDYTGGAGAYALVGMGAAFAGIVRVPLTSVIMIFEMTRDYTIIVPLMISNLISFYISYRLQREPIYDALQHQDGVHLPSVRLDREGMLTVQDAVVAPEFVPGEYPTGDDVPYVYMDHSLDLALRRMAETKTSVLPVVSRANANELVGLVTLDGILHAYGIGGDEYVDAPRPPLEPEPRIRFIPGLIAAALSVVVLLGIVNYYRRTDRAVGAEKEFQTAGELISRGQYQDAIQQYRDALSVSPGNARYRLALGLTLAKTGQMREAAVYLNEVLKVDPENGPANLATARMDATLGKTKDAELFYRRAIDASWPAGAEAERMAARLELAQTFQKSGQQELALAQLMAAAAQGNSAEAYAALGKAEFAEEKYPEASAAFHDAVRLNPSDKTLVQLASLSDRILALDPDRPGLRVAERYRRSRALLQAAVSDWDQCQAPSYEADTARKALSKRVRPVDFDDATAENISLAVHLTNARAASCRPREDEATIRLLSRYAATEKK